MTPTCYPIALVLDGKPCLVVGGGEIADGKLDALLLAGAVVTVVSPEVRPRIAALAAEGRITLRQRPYRTGDLEGPTSSSPPPTINRSMPGSSPRRAPRAFLDAGGRRHPYCDFFAVAMVRRGDLQLGISTNGRSPAFARWMRERLDTELPPNTATCWRSSATSGTRSRRAARSPSTSTGRRRSPTRFSLPWAPATARRRPRASTSGSRPGSGPPLRRGVPHERQRAGSRSSAPGPAIPS